MFGLINDVCQNKIGKQYTLKPTFNYKIRWNGIKTQDKSKPKVSYFKLITCRDHKTNKITISTKIYDQKAKNLIDPIYAVSKLWLIRPMVHVQKIYFGSHGNSGYNARIQAKLVKAYFETIFSELFDFPDEE